MNHLFFDTETTGLPFNNFEKGHPEYPHILQIAVLLTDENFIEQAAFSSLVRIPKEAIIHPKALEAHGITKEKTEKFGIPCEVAMIMFNELMMQSDYQVAHNFKFDYTMLKKAESYYFQKEFLEFTKPVCTMELTTNILKLPGKGHNKYKWPKLQEAYEYYYKKQFDKAHDALADCRACAAVYKAYKEQSFVVA